VYKSSCCDDKDKGNSLDFPKSFGTINTTSLPFRNGGIVENSLYLLNSIGIQILAQISVRKGTAIPMRYGIKGSFSVIVIQKSSMHSLKDNFY